LLGGVTWDVAVIGMVEIPQGGYEFDDRRCFAVLTIITPTEVEDGAIYQAPPVYLDHDWQGTDFEPWCDGSELEAVGWENLRYPNLENLDVPVGTPFPLYTYMAIPAEWDDPLIAVRDYSGWVIYFEGTVLSEIPAP
jgi:hypothetical protein